MNHTENQHLKYEVEDDFQSLLEKVRVRFDTNPKYYLKEDFKKLIDLLALVVKGITVDIPEAIPEVPENEE